MKMKWTPELRHAFFMRLLNMFHRISFVARSGPIGKINN